MTGSSQRFPRLSSPRSGFTLVEALVGLVLGAVVAGIALRLFLRLHWAGLAQSETSQLQTALRSGAFFLTSELRELGGTPGDPDVLVFAPESLTYRAMRGVGLSCGGSSSSVLLDATGWSSYRSLQPGRDEILLHYEGRALTATHDRWLTLPILGVSQGACGTTPAIRLTTVLDTTTFPINGFAPLEPVRSFEVMQIKLYQSGSDFWLGARSVSAGEAIQPLAGPFTRNGLEFRYLDSTGAPTTVAGDVRAIGITLRAISSSAIRTGGGFASPARRMDSLETGVTLRNW